MPQDTSNPSQADLISFAEVTKTAEEIKDAYVYQNLAVPLFGGDRNIHDFLADFERATWTLEPYQRTKLVHKAFPVDRYKPWFESTLRPLVEQKASWETVKEAIVKRFSGLETTDIHFQKLLQSQYKAGTKLLDFIEELSYWYKKAHSKEPDDSGCVKFIKTKLPVEVTSVLNFMPDFRTARTVGQLYEVARQFDANPISLNFQRNIPDTKYFDGKMEEIKRQVTSAANETYNKLMKNQEAMAAAYEHVFKRFNTSPSKHYRPYQDHDQRSSLQRTNSRERIDKYSGYQGNNTPPRSKSPSSSQPSSPYAKQTYYQRSKSPNGFKNSGSRRNSIEGIQNQNGEGSSAKTLESSKSRVLDSKKYYTKFGYPSKPCVTCGDMHHDRHCPFNLK